ncbi:HD-GYP domain-containing protein [Megalodesulfovibrio paquesii]
MCVWELKAGMFVADTGLSWLEHPHLYDKEGLIVSAEQVDALVKEGYVDVFVDPARSTYVFEIDDLSDEKSMADDVRTLPESKDEGAAEVQARHEAMQAEMATAKKLYVDAIKNVRSYLDAAREGTLPELGASEALVEQVIESLLRSDDALVSLTKLKSFDEYTYTHSLNVSVLSVSFGKALRLPKHQLQLLGLAGLFHDLGKQRIPPEVLNKPGKLTSEEFEVIKSHPERGHALCLAAGLKEPAVLRGILEHHEKYNGSGYPARLQGSGVHLFGRIITVADVYDALTSRRVYKNGMLPNKALSIMYNMRGEDFFPGMVERFIKSVGIYPVGSLVRLSDFSHGVVVSANPFSPLLPMVRVAFDERMRPRSQELVNLAEEKSSKGISARKIEDCLDPRHYNLDISALVA